MGKIKDWLLKNYIDFPRYDPETDTIKNAVKHSHSWFHEMRHRKQFKTIPNLLKVYDITLGFGYYLAGMFGFYFIVIGYFKEGITWIGLCMFPYIFLTTILEIDAWIMGTIDWLKWKRKQKNY